MARREPIIKCTRQPDLFKGEDMKSEVKLVEWFDDHWYKVTIEKEENVFESVYLPSVTTKLNIVAKPFLATWRGDIGNREADLRVFEACESGVRIHHALNILANGGAVVYQPNQKPVYTEPELQAVLEEHAGNVAIIRYQDEMYDVLKLKKWFDVVKPKILGTEVTVYDLENRDAGTLDLILDIEEGDYAINGSKPLHLPKGIYIVDLKTGKVVDDNAYMQTACYGVCHKKMFGLDPIGTLVIHTGAFTKKAIEGLATHYRTKEQMDEDYKDYRLAAQLWERKHRDDQPETFEFPSLLKL
jgi:hypothetical protein